MYGLDKPPFKESIVWTEAIFDWGWQVGICGEYKERRKAARLHKRPEDALTYAARCGAEWLVMQWHREQEKKMSREKHTSGLVERHEDPFPSSYDEIDVGLAKTLRKEQRRAWWRWLLHFDWWRP